MGRPSKRLLPAMSAVHDHGPVSLRMIHKFLEDKLEPSPSDPKVCDMIAFSIKAEDYDLTNRLINKREIPNMVSNIAQLFLSSELKKWSKWFIWLVSKDNIRWAKKILHIKELSQTPEVLSKALYIHLQCSFPDPDLILEIYLHNPALISYQSESPYHFSEFSLRGVLTKAQSSSEEINDPIRLICHMGGFTPIIEKSSQEDINNMLNFFINAKQSDLLITFLKKDKNATKIDIENFERGLFGPYQKDWKKQRVTEQGMITDLISQAIKDRQIISGFDSELITLLLLLVSRHEIESIKNIFRKLDIQRWKDENKNTALHVLMQYEKPNDNFEQLVMIFFNYWRFLALDNNNGEFPLLIAAKKGYFQLIYKICDNTEAVEQHTEEQISKLIAILKSHPEHLSTQFTLSLFKKCDLSLIWVDEEEPLIGKLLSKQLIRLIGEDKIENAKTSLTPILIRQGEIFIIYGLANRWRFTEIDANVIKSEKSILHKLPWESNKLKDDNHFSENLVGTLKQDDPLFSEKLVEILKRGHWRFSLKMPKKNLFSYQGALVNTLSSNPASLAQREDPESKESTLSRRSRSGSFYS